MRIPTILSSFRGAPVSLRGLSLLLLALGSVPLFYWSSNPVHAAQAAGFGGNHEVADCVRISGWAWNVNQPNSPISVDIYVDDVLTAQVSADGFRQDLLDAGIGNGNHAFTFATPTGFIDGQPHSVQVQFTGTNIDLTNTPRTITCSNTEVDFRGNHETADCMRISGWAWDANQPTTPISVDVYLDDDNFASVRAPANQFRQDLLDAGIGDGFHGFSFPPPEFLKDGQPHVIRMKFAFTSMDVPGTPRSITCSGNPVPVFQGNQDRTDCNEIAGWAWDANQPNTPISVDIFAGSVFIANVPADQFRQDLLDAGIGNGAHAFKFLVPLSLKDGMPHSIGVGFGGTFIGLPNTPQVITCTGGPAYQGNHEVADCTRISGWAWDANQPTTPISVDIFDGAALIATVPANEFRQDLLDAGIGDGMHGFTFTTPLSLKNGQPHSIRVRFAGTSTDLLNTPKTINCPSP